MLKNKKGITLIALVVTIIVLLILAGVTLSFVAGENGILKRATNAVDINEIATAEEQADLLVAELVTQYYEEKYVNHKANLGTVDDYIKIQLTNKQTTEDYTVQYDEDTNNIIVSKNQQPISSGEITNGKINWTYSTVGEEKPKPSIPEQVSSINMGEYVDLETNILDKTIALSDGTTPKTDWRIFYKEGNDVYLIMSDYLPYSYNSTLETGLTSAELYNWRSATNRDDLITELKDTNKWNKLISNDLVTKGAIATGALEIETWVKAWNEDGGTHLVTSYVTSGYGAEGYLISCKESGDANDYEVYNLDNSKTLFFPHNDDKMPNIWGYWLASLSASNTSRNIYTTYAGCVGWGGCTSSGVGVRPTICIPSNVLTKRSDGIWKVEAK